MTDKQEEEIDKLVDEWHDSDTELTLYEFLGMTLKEYEAYVGIGILSLETKGNNNFKWEYTLVDNKTKEEFTFENGYVHPNVDYSVKVRAIK